MRGGLWLIMPNKDEVEACREIMESAPNTRVIMPTASTEKDAVIEAVAAGATGGLRRCRGWSATVRDVAAGELRVPADVVTRVFARIRAGAELGEAKGLGDLMERDLEVLAPFCRGMSYAKIAEARGVKPSTPCRASWRRLEAGDCGLVGAERTAG